MKKIFLSCLCACALSLGAVGYDGRHGWPVQKAPEKIIVCSPTQNRAEEMLLQSLSGLAAQAVNDGRCDEMVWCYTDNPAYKRIYGQTVTALGIKQEKQMNVWEVLDYLKKRHVVRGYVLYRMDKERSEYYASHKDTDYSCNVATVYAALLRGVLIDESLQAKAESFGLKLLKDARNEDMTVCFEKNRTHLNDCSALSVPPGVPNMRDYAIAHRLMLYADEPELMNKVLEWVRPLSPILGWGCGDEYDFTSVISEWGHYNTATNWCINLPLISSASDFVELNKLTEISPVGIDYASNYSCHTYVMSDGDNMQWTMGNFIDSDIYMGNSAIHDIGLSWTLCPVNLSIVSPVTWNELVGFQTPNFTYLEYGGGYQYPDLFAVRRPNRQELLREFARRLDYHFKQLNLSVFGCICKDISSKEAQEAFEIYAQEIEPLAGILAVQYFPYEQDGRIYWVQNSDGISIPVITASCSIWNEVRNDRPRAGAPEYVASLINREYLAASQRGDNMLGWTIVHAWSDFSQTSKLLDKSGAAGVYPVCASERLLLDSIWPVPINELIWRIRMKYRKNETMQLLQQHVN